MSVGSVYHSRLPEIVRYWRLRHLFIESSGLQSLEEEAVNFVLYPLAQLLVVAIGQNHLWVKIRQKIYS